MRVDTTGGDFNKNGIQKSVFTLRGNECADTNFYSVSAKNADGLELNPNFITIMENGSELDLTFDATINSGENYTDLKYAVYITVTNQANPLVTNWYCLMVTPCPDGTGDCPSYQSTGSSASYYTLCEEYCQANRANPFQ